MRKLLSFLMTSVDGYHEGPNREFDWPLVDAEFSEYSVDQLEEVDTLVFGRVTYEGMAAYWPTDAARGDDPRVAAVMNSISKIVVSRTLDVADWTNTRLLKNDIVAGLTALKEQPGKDIAIFGSSTLTSDLIAEGLVDELRIIISPVALGAGRSVLQGLDRRVGLTLLRTRTFTSGNVLLTYRPTTAKEPS